MDVEFIPGTCSRRRLAYHNQMRLSPCLIIVLSLAACAESDSPLQTKTRQWLTTTWPEIDARGLKLRNVKIVADKVCGEVDFDYMGRRSGFRLFYHKKDGSEGSFDRPGRDLLPGQRCDGIQYHIRLQCAQNDSERRSAEYEEFKCSAQNDI